MKKIVSAKKGKFCEFQIDNEQYFSDKNFHCDGDRCA